MHYTVVAVVALVGGVVLAITALATGQATADAVALSAPLVGLAGTVIGRGNK